MKKLSAFIILTIVSTGLQAQYQKSIKINPFVADSLRVNNGSVFSSNVRINGSVGLNTDPGKILHLYHTSSNAVALDRSATWMWSGFSFHDNGIANERWFIGQKGNSNNLAFRQDASVDNMQLLDGTGALALQSSSVPSSPLSGFVLLYTSVVSNVTELFSMDDAGNTTPLSPHNPETGEWWFISKNVKTGRVIRVDLERFFKWFDREFGTNFMYEWYESRRLIDNILPRDNFVKSNLSWRLEYYNPWK